MNDSLLRKFCESDHRKLIVVIVTTLFGLLVLIPLVDDYFDNKESHSTLTEDLGVARKVTEGLPELEQAVAKVTDELKAIESRAVSEASVSQYRSKLVEIVRESGCQVRRLDVGQPARRAWHENDDPLKKLAAGDKNKKKTPFTLEQRSVVLLVDGPTESVQELLKQIHKDDTFAYMHRVELHSGARSGENVTLELEMWLFALGRHKA